MKILITGSRNYFDYKYFTERLKKVIMFIKVEVEFVFGDAEGIDKMAMKFCIENGFKYKRFEADWNRYKLSAGPIRNQAMVDYCEQSDWCIGFPTKNSKGTHDCMRKADYKGMKLITVNL